MFASLVTVTFGLIFFKAAPADFPYSVKLTRGLAGVIAVLAYIWLSMLLPPGIAVSTAVGGVLGLTFFVHGLLKATKLQNRFLQTLGAQLAVGVLFAVAMLPAFAALAPALSAMLKDPSIIKSLQAGQTPAINPPAWAAHVVDILFFWNLAVVVRINRLAANLSLPASILLTFISLFVVLGFITLTQLVMLPFIK